MSMADENKQPEAGAVEQPAAAATPVPSAAPENLADPTRHLDALEDMIAAEAPAASVKDEVKKMEGAKRTTIKQNTEIKMEPVMDGENRARPEVLVTPGAPFQETMNRLNSLTSSEVSGNPAYGNWAATVQGGMARMSHAAAADDIFARQSALWVQSFTYGNTRIGQAATSKKPAEGEILTGAQAINAAQRYVGIGGNFTTVLPHSGFYVTLKPPMEESILELHRQINQIKTEVGRQTYGLLLGGESGLVNELFVRFALTSILRNSIKDADNILAIMSVHDINILIWGYLCTIYPNGFNHRVACMADPFKCQHIVEDKINVRRLFFMNKNAFSETQLAHLSSQAAGSMSVEDVTKYREEMRKNEHRTITLNEGEEDEVSIELRVPSALEYFQSTHRWIDSIGDKVVAALGADSTYNERNLLINEHASSTQMRKYAHWVDRIHIDGGIVDREKSGAESIEQVLDSWSSSISMREEFSDKVAEYVKDTCQAQIGIPDFKCPNCKEWQISESETHPVARSIIGIDVPMTFFTVLVQRAQLIKG